MADKEATVYVIDLGESMSDCHNGREESDLDFAMRYVWDKISTTVSANRKTWTVGVVGFNTDDTDNPQDREGLEGYENISVLQEIGSMTMSSLRRLRSLIKPSHSSSGDAISAVVVALDMIEKFTKKLKYKRKIILVTNGHTPIDDDSTEDVALRLNQSSIELVVVGVDFDDPECTEGVFGTMAEAVEELAIPRIKPIRPYRSYEGLLTLGDPDQYESAISFHVERWTKTKVAIVPSASTVTVTHGPGGSSQTQTLDGEDVEMAGTELSNIKNTRTYFVKDPNAPGGKRDVPADEVERGYLYGETAVPFSESDYTVIKFDAKKSFTILGFIPFSSYQPFLSMGEAGCVVAQRNNPEAEIALSSFIHTLYELESYAVARFVQKDGAQPQILLLKPNPGIEDEFECLYDVPLPFAEDVRNFPFPPLDKVLTVTGNVLNEHRLLPSNDLRKAMSDFVDAMDLSKFDVDEEGNPAEYATLDDMYNPTIHLPPKAQGRRGKKETVKPLSGLDVDALLSDTGRSKRVPTISAENAIPEFKQALATAADDATIQSAAHQMGEIIRKLIADSFANLTYARAAECLRVMREELVALEEPRLYNKFIRGLKKSILSGELNGDRREMWAEHIAQAGLGLITNDESEVSDVTLQQASEFLRPSNK
ncbi:uncharacterized protein CTHT_0025310 [Thermochaetoides thermophila DSM 1495]|uniref:ATP-dependent DNA helicase II subunit 2 n=1 Tax=Chaetomium thermophilum (strain DSM 1495 / CBS 144.50 / IMI 039719) TaxID=759272 RepID=G0S5X9_CHATD|nr:hypothetical protein CTHT_0025310 [Thermochaetoides thermophila DSM 1495]EGS20695.1 hypothetical protein CTHT_0025310 [Thermochaetoides thermophila DSM 1495]